MLSHIKEILMVLGVIIVGVVVMPIVMPIGGVAMGVLVLLLVPYGWGKLFAKLDKKWRIVLSGATAIYIGYIYMYGLEHWGMLIGVTLVSLLFYYGVFQEDDDNK